MPTLKKIHAILGVISAIYPKTTNTLKVIGALYILKKLLSILASLYRTILRPRKNLTKRYGSKSWALVTGSTEGIGRAFAFELARMGFNIIICARTKSKLESTSAELKSKYPEIQVEFKVIDFSDSARPDYLVAALEDLFKLNISVLINNVGVDVLDYYHNLSEQQINKLIHINCTAMSQLCRMFIPRFRERYEGTHQKSAIVNVTSLAGIAEHI